MNPFNDLGDTECSMDMGHPMEIEAKGNRMLSADELLHLESFILKHLQRNVDDSYLEAMALQILRKTGKSDGIHLKDGCGRDDVADGTMDSDSFPEVVNRRGMKEDKIEGWHLHCLGGGDLSGSEGYVFLKSSINL